jgi:hypothetical protein
MVACIVFTSLITNLTFLSGAALQADMRRIMVFGEKVVLRTKQILN